MALISGHILTGDLLVLDFNRLLKKHGIIFLMWSGGFQSSPASSTTSYWVRFFLSLCSSHLFFLTLLFYSFFLPLLHNYSFPGGYIFCICLVGWRGSSVCRKGLWTDPGPGDLNIGPPIACQVSEMNIRRDIGQIKDISTRFGPYVPCEPADQLSAVSVLKLYRSIYMYRHICLQIPEQIDFSVFRIFS